MKCKMIIENGYKNRKEEKRRILYCRMDDSMIEELSEIRNQTGISVSELLREGARRLIKEVKENNSIRLI
jgi:hypothetical protein